MSQEADTIGSVGRQGYDLPPGKEKGVCGIRRGLKSAVGAAVCLVCAAGIVSAQEAAPASLPGAGSRPAVGSAAAVRPLRVVLFYSQTCPGCGKVLKALAASERRWGARIRVEKQDLADVATFRDLILYEKHYGSKEDETLKVFVGGRYLAGPKAIVKRLNGVIADELARGALTFVPPEPAGPATEGLPSEILERFRGFSVGAVVVAGLLDGINPCAFTTIIFLLSMLAYLGKSKRQLAVVGIGFTSAVFVTYFLLGLGLLGAIKTFSVSRGIATGMAYGVAALAFALAGWSLIDSVRYSRTGDVKKITLNQ